MTYTFKLSRRLAASATGLTALLWLGLAACSDSTAPPPLAEGSESAAEAELGTSSTTTFRRLALNPNLVTLAPGGSKQFRAQGVTSTRTKVPVAATFRATGGTITSTGLYTAGSTPGTFRIVATFERFADTSVVTIARIAGSTSLGVPFGPFGAWDGNTLKPNTEYFTSSIGGYTPSNIIPRLEVARAKRLKLVLGMTGGGREQYLTDGVFDVAKWKAKMDGYNTPAIREAVAAAVAEGLIAGNTVMDEPNNDGGPGNEANSWGPRGTMTKARVDEMCRYVKAIFPTLPVGVTHDHRTFEPDQSYRVCEFIVSQYRSSKGDVQGFRDSGLALARRDGHKIAFSLNVMDGGFRDNDRDGEWECPVPLTGGRGTYAPNCRMTPEQIEEYGRVLSVGCALTLWRYDEEFMAKSANRTAFGNLRAFLAGVAPPGCGRG